MPKFLKILLGSCLGTLLALGVLILIGLGALSGLANSASEQPNVEPNSVLTIELDNVPELTGNAQPTDPFANFGEEPTVGLHDAVRAIENAMEDDDIKGIYLNDGISGANFTTMRSLRQAVARFRESGKFVVSYSPYYSQSAYYMGSAADEVYVGPLGVVDFRGLGAEIAFFKKALDQAGIRFEIFYAGDYKSATEPLRRTNISEENREQTKEFLEGLFQEMLADISDSRGVSTDRLRQAANRMTGWRDQEAVDAGLIDGILRRTEVDRLLHDKLGLDYEEKIPAIDISTYFNARLQRLTGGDDEVAVLIAEGGIVDGQGDLGIIGDKRYVNEIEKLAEDDDVKAVVLRINSGGGSASSSENIWYAIEQLKETGKPIIVSMGDYAASGGYYIAAGADRIYAEPTTITGSIGVFLTFPVINELMSDKIGITFDTVNTADNATGFSTFRGLTEEQKQLLTQRTQAIYTTFVQRVADGRDLDTGRVRQIAGGRVYTGRRALELGLVDELGTLEQAIAAAAEQAGLEDDYAIGHYPRIKPFWQQFIEEITGTDSDNGVATRMLRDQLGPHNYAHFLLIRDMARTREPQARLPLVVNF